MALSAAGMGQAQQVTGNGKAVWQARQNQCWQKVTGEGVLLVQREGRQVFRWWQVVRNQAGGGAAERWGGKATGCSNQRWYAFHVSAGMNNANQTVSVAVTGTIRQGGVVPA